MVYNTTCYTWFNNIKRWTKLDICIGEDENDPVFCITDLLPHLAQDQMQKKLADGITGEQLNLLIGSIPLEGSKRGYRGKYIKNTK